VSVFFKNELLLKRFGNTKLAVKSSKLSSTKILTANLFVGKNSGGKNGFFFN
jgi:hypothetical protein